jgi:tetratricopeptide (TPR) repeat protein
MNYDFDLGEWSRPVSRNVTAQRWFDAGLNWLYGYNHEEAVACFKRASSADPNCAMAWWGIAYAAGPFYNRPWIRYSDAEVREALPMCHEAAQRASALCTNDTPENQALARTVIIRYPQNGETNRDTLAAWHQEFAHEMLDCATRHPDDLDIAALSAEAAVTCTPRQLWDLNSGAPSEGALTVEAVAVLNRAMEQMRAHKCKHPGVLHMMIHALEMSRSPQDAMPAADLLRGYGRDLGHLEHMSGHIDVLCGNYAQAVEQSRRAILADDKYVAHGGAANFYTTSRCHDFHLCMYAAMFLGQFNTAIQAADRICNIATPELLGSSFPFMASILDGYAAMRTHVMVRFGRWHDLLDEPAPADAALTPIRFAMHAYGQGVAAATLGQFERAEQAREQFNMACKRFSPEDIFLSNPVTNVLGGGEAMLNGELAYHRKQYDAAFEYLREAVRRDDSLNYTEPWAWMHPPRHALGALLAEQGHFDEAQAVYRADLGFDDNVPRCCVHPNNIWSLHGLVECVEHQGDQQQAKILRQALEFAQARADVPVTASCCCRLTTSTTNTSH